MQSLFGYLTINLFYELFKIIMLCYFLKVYLHNLQLDFIDISIYFLCLTIDYVPIQFLKIKVDTCFHFHICLKSEMKVSCLKHFHWRLAEELDFTFYSIILWGSWKLCFPIVLHIHLYSLYKNILGNSRVLFKDFTVKIFYYLPCQYQDPTAPMNSWSPV